MPFELRITEVDYQDSTPWVSGRLISGRYFGPENVEIALPDGSVFRASVGGMQAKTPQGWPILPEHDTILQLELIAGPAAQISEGSILRGIGVSSVAPTGWRNSNDWLDDPLFWALHLFLLAGDGETDESELCPALFGISSEMVNEFFVERFTSAKRPQPWPYFSLTISGDHAVEVEYADTAEFQTRYKIVDATGAITVGYDSGHFSLPAFRWPELLLMANRCTDAIHRDRLILLLCPSVYIGTSEQTEAVRELEMCFGRLGLFNAETRSTLATNIVGNREGETPWSYHQLYGWVSASEYAQRNPKSLLSQLTQGELLRIKAYFEELDGK
jgi:hypothetical protein